MSLVNIEQIVQQAQQGDRDAIETLYQHHAPMIYRYIYYRISAIQDAEDLMAEVFVKMVQGLPAYQFRGAPFEAWLYRIASARIVDYRRRNRRHPQTPLMDNVADSNILPEEALQNAQELETLRHALKQFSDEEQTLLILRFVERKSHQEVAEVLGKSPGAVKSMQHRALTRLSSLLGSDNKVRHYLRGGHHE